MTPTSIAVGMEFKETKRDAPRIVAVTAAIDRSPAFVLVTVVSGPGIGCVMQKPRKQLANPAIWRRIEVSP